MDSHDWFPEILKENFIILILDLENLPTFPFQLITMTYFMDFLILGKTEKKVGHSKFKICLNWLLCWFLSLSDRSHVTKIQLSKSKILFSFILLEKSEVHKFSGLTSENKKPEDTFSKKNKETKDDYLLNLAWLSKILKIYIYIFNFKDLPKLPFSVITVILLDKSIFHTFSGWDGKKARSPQIYTLRSN